MKKKLLVFVLLSLGLCTGCGLKPVQAPVPGSNSTPDAVAFRVAADAQAALHSIKTWQGCAAANFPQTLSVDDKLEPCDPAAGPFPDKLVPLLNTAIKSYNELATLGKAAHDGILIDQGKLDAAEQKLKDDVSAVLAGGK